MGLFDKKYCDVCGERIGLLGNRKLEDGNLCKDCARKLSPWFSERRNSSVNEIKRQLEYREENRGRVEAFHITRTLGSGTKLLLDEDAGLFMVTSAKNIAEANPDVLALSDVTGCTLDVEESSNELLHEDKDGNEVSYNPPRYEYSYDFYMLNKTGDPLLDWWNGQWYGWWTLTGGTGAYEEMNNNWWDVSGIIEIGSDYMGTVTLWDEDYSRSNPMVDAAVSLNSAGTGEHGTMMSEGGWFTDIRLEHADWIVDPGLSEFDAMICIDGWYENGDDEYRYEIYLRPWGTYWDDVAEEGRPYLYDDWYIPLIEKNALMPDVIGGEATEFAGGGSQGGSQGGEATQTGATGGDYGKSNANATGQVSREVMDRAILSLKGDFIWDDVKYEDIRELLGTDGVPYTEFDSWRADRHTYEWFAPERVTLLVAFKVENGEEISNSWTSGSWDGPEYDVTPVKLGSRPEGSGNMIDQSVTITDSRQNVEATVMFKIPEGAWCVDPGVRSSFQIINNPTTDNVPFQTPYIKVELFETSESLNYYEKDFENLTELESRAIGGVTMNGRSYKNVGIEWIEFYGQIPSGGWISIRLAYMSADPGSDCSNILDSMSFK